MAHNISDSRRRTHVFGASRLLALPMLVWLFGCMPPPTAREAPTAAPARLGPTSTAEPTALPPTPQLATPTPAPIPPVSADDWHLGPEGAAFTLLVYSDFQCPACARLAGVLTDLRSIHPDDLQIVFRPYPLWPIEDKALIAAQAAEAAGAQGRFWEMHDLLFSAADEWTDLRPEDFRAWLQVAARSLSLDHQRFDQAMDEATYAERALQDFDAGLASGLVGVPTVFVNGTLVAMQPTLTNLEALIRLAQVEARGLPEGPPEPADPGQSYVATLDTDFGPIEIELEPSAAPQAVGSFVYLAQQGWYDDTSFHRVVPGVLVESGDPTHTGLAGPAYRFGDEYSDSLSFADIGMVGLRSEGPGSNGGIFFINLSPLPDLDGNHTIIGRVTAGIELLQQLPARDPLSDLLEPPPLMIESVTIRASRPE